MSAPRRTIMVLGTTVIKQGEGAKGPWTLRKVEATDPDGQPISLPLKTFADLQPGEVDVEVEIQESEQYGRSYLLKPVKRTGGNGGGELADLRARVARLESEVKRLSSVIDRRDFDPSAPTPAPAAPANF